MINSMQCSLKSVHRNIHACLHVCQKFPTLTASVLFISLKQRATVGTNVIFNVVDVETVHRIEPACITAGPLKDMRKKPIYRDCEI